MPKRYKPGEESNNKECHFGWETLKEMKTGGVEFWAADEFKKVQIVEIDEKTKNIYMICCQSAKITWPLNFKKLEEVHARIHRGDLGLNAYEIDKVIPTWGNYITGLLRFLGCRRP